ncbi:siderophore-iron reductase FhuF [Scandinavium manionii]|uniref:siderophore-iron reductase FhuF n=1 Tax=Scandinavium manionii TaxID=2926520 RepID=UPI002166993C|nr:siderophore-iron reductase FhuF [Scandinavium manionii]MCS2149274.1 siderophore-iron reductase FhuF [Scandinavium manionii]MCS2165286.1 siderophore-iron reductase FhuF [Scandinavium manionii]
MAYRSAPITDDIIWRAPLFEREQGLAASLQNKFAEHRPHLLDFIRLDEPHPHQTMTLAQWSRHSELTTLCAQYSDHIYRNNFTQTRENKPLLSLWAQWYIGLQVPPLMLALLTEKRALSLSPQHFHVEFHETGRAAKFWVDVQEDPYLTQQSSLIRMENLVTQTLVPVIEALEATGEINAKLIWSNTGYLINWYLGEMKTLLGDEQVNSLRQHLFFEKQFSDGRDNPLWRTVVMREGLLVRRTCCQRYRLPDVQQCGDCTLK